MVKIAFLAPYSKKHFYAIRGVPDLSVHGKDVWFFKYMPDRSIEVDIIGCLASLSYRKRIPLVMWQIISFLPFVRRYDVVISSGFFNGILFSVVRKLLRFRKPAHIILDTRAIGVLKPERRLLIGIARYLLSPVDGVVCFARNHQELWEETLGFSGKVVFTPWPMMEDVEQVFPLTGDYVFSGGSTRRDWPTLISAVENTAARVTIVAGKDTALGKYGLEEVDVPPNVKVLRDIPRLSYVELLAKSRFVVIPLQEVPYDVGWDTLCQAMTLGKAVVATRIPPLVDYIIDGETGIFVDPGDVDDLRDKILFLLAHPEEVQRIGANAKRVMEETKSGRKVAGEGVWSMLQRVWLNRKPRRCR